MTTAQIKKEATNFLREKRTGFVSLYNVKLTAKQQQVFAEVLTDKETGRKYRVRQIPNFVNIETV